MAWKNSGRKVGAGEILGLKEVWYPLVPPDHEGRSRFSAFHFLLPSDSSVSRLATRSSNSSNTLWISANVVVASLL